jgi:hypothetical protein
MPELKGIFEKYRSYDRFAMIGFALDEKENVVRKFVAKENIQWPQAVLNKEFDDPIVRQYKVHGIPTDYLIGPDGKVVALSGFDGYLKRVLGVTEINR